MPLFCNGFVKICTYCNFVNNAYLLFIIILQCLKRLCDIWFIPIYLFIYLFIYLLVISIAKQAILT